MWTVGNAEKHEIGSILAPSFERMSTVPQAIFFPTTYYNQTSLLIEQYRCIINQMFLNSWDVLQIRNVFPNISNFLNYSHLNNPIDSSNTLDPPETDVPQDFKTDNFDDANLSIDIESLDDYESKSIRKDTEEQGKRKDFREESDSDCEEDFRKDFSYKYSSRHLTWMDTRKLTRGNCGEDRVFHVLQKKKGKPRGRTVRASLTTTTTHSEHMNKTIERPVKSTSRHNTKLKRKKCGKSGESSVADLHKL